MDHHSYILGQIREQLDIYDVYQDVHTHNNDDDDDSAIEESSDALLLPSQTNFNHVYLGAPQKPVTFSDFEALHTQDLAFKDFQKRLSLWLDHALNVWGVPRWSQPSLLRFNANDMVS